MQIFILDIDPKQAAIWHCDAHVIKIILESAQLLCTAINILDNKLTPYKPTHRNHPCAIWARKSKQNFDWLISYAEELCAEYTARYGKIHKTQAVISWCKNNKPTNIPNIGLTPFALAIPDEYKIKGDPVASYRNYYRLVKVAAGFCTWKRNKPSWL